MITFHSPTNIIVTKRSYFQKERKKSEKKEKFSYNFYNNKNNSSTFYNKSTLSLSSLKLNSNSRKKNGKNIVHSKIIKKASDINLHTKKIKREIISNKNLSENQNKKKSNNLKNKSNVNTKIKLDDIDIYSHSDINENMINNFINSYPKPEPMPIKIIKYNNDINNTKINGDIEYNYNYFSPNNIINNNNLDFDMNNKKYYNAEKAQSEKKYYSNLQKFFENNKSKGSKKYKKGNINNVNYNNFDNFIQNINNINNEENYNYDKNIMNLNNKYDKKMIYILSSLNLDNLIDVFNSNYIGFNDLLLLTKKDLIEMKIPIGQRNRFLHFFDKFKNGSKNYDFNEIKNYLDIYKKMYINNLFIEKNKSNKINTLPNYKNNNSFKNNIMKGNATKEENLFLINTKDNESRIILDHNIYEKQKTNDNNVLCQANSYLRNNISQINKYSNNNSNKNSSKKEYINISIFQRNNKSGIETNKNSPSFSSISNSKVAFIDELNFQNKNLMNKRSNPKNSSTITSNIEQIDTTTTTINNKINSNHFTQKCNNILNEVDNFNTIYTQLKQKSQNRNKQISLLLNKKNNIENFKEQANYKDYLKEREQEKSINNEIDNIYRIDNNCLNEYNEFDLYGIDFLKEESIRDLNKELQMNSIK